MAVSMAILEDWQSTELTVPRVKRWDQRTQQQLTRATPAIWRCGAQDSAK
jgi:hypothetical protein